MTEDRALSSVPVGSAGLSRRARRFVEADAIRVTLSDLRPYRAAWTGQGIPAAEIDRAVAFQDRWGGLALPAAPFYEGGPHIFDADCPQVTPEGGWSFPAGNCRVSMAYGFRIGPDGAFGIDGHRWTPLHTSTEGWVESLALAAHARRWARTITQVTGEAVDSLDLDDYELVPEVRGVTDTWWRGRDSLVAVYRGEAVGLDAPQCLTAHIYDGLDEWGLQGTTRGSRTVRRQQANHVPPNGPDQARSQGPAGNLP